MTASNPSTPTEHLPTAEAPSGCPHQPGDSLRGSIPPSHDARIESNKSRQSGPSLREAWAAVKASLTDVTPAPFLTSWTTSSEQPGRQQTRNERTSSVEALDRQGMERLVARGCATPGCRHEHHGPMYLHSRCHRGAPVTASYLNERTLEVACAFCGKPVLRLAVKEHPELTPCHSGRPVEVEYTAGRGTVHIHCFGSKRLLAAIPLQ